MAAEVVNPSPAKSQSELHTRTSSRLKVQASSRVNEKSVTSDKYLRALLEYEQRPEDHAVIGEEAQDSENMHKSTKKLMPTSRNLLNRDGSIDELQDQEEERSPEPYQDN